MKQRNNVGILLWLSFQKENIGILQSTQTFFYIRMHKKPEEGHKLHDINLIYL
jgi:hypothetical protein